MAILLFFFIIGLMVGSFLNVCIWRIPRQKSIIFPPSHCPQCGQPIKVRDNIPLVSYLFLRGRCRFCKTKISLRYPLVEFLTAIIFLLLFLKFGAGFKLFSSLILVSLLIMIFFIDLEHLIIPDTIVFPGLGLGIIFSFSHGFPSPLETLWGLLFGGGVLYLIALLSGWIARKESMGGGDVKLAAMIGTFLGWKMTALSLILAFISGALISLVLLAVKIKGRKDVVPFGPFIAVGGIVSLLAGEKIFQWYRAFLP